jgi:hypothetical protein
VIIEDHKAEAALLDCSGVIDTCFVGVSAGAVVIISSCASMREEKERMLRTKLRRRVWDLIL